MEDYVHLHADPWPELIELLESCHMHNYSISVRGTEVFTIYAYTGDNYEADCRRMDESPVMQLWWTYSKPCFLHHDRGHYYDEMTEVFYKK